MIDDARNVLRHRADFFAARLWIDRDVHAAITKSGQTLQEAADKAFALLMATMRKRKAR